MKKCSRKIRINVTCTSCGAYSFPHRLGGGKCTGSEWAEHYRLVDSSMCIYCNCNNNGQCDVSNGPEHIRECEGALEYHDSGDKLTNIEDFGRQDEGEQ